MSRLILLETDPKCIAPFKCDGMYAENILIYHLWRD